MPRKLTNIINFAVLFVVSLLIMIPLFWAAKSVFTPNGEIFTTKLLSLPSHLSLQNIRDGLAAAPFLMYFKNSVIVAVSITATVVVTSAMTGFGFSKFDFRGKNLLFGFIIAAMLMPFQAILIPLFIEVKYLGWLDSLKGLIIPGSVSAFGIFMMRQFISGIPNELIEAALIDGCSAWKVFKRIIVPMAKSPLSALGALAFLASWNNYLWPLVVVQSEESMTIPLGLSAFRGNNATAYSQIFAVSLIAAIPVVILFVVMRRQIVSSFATSGIK